MDESKRISMVCQRWIQWILAGVIVLSPWFFGSTEPIFEFAVVVSLAIVLMIAAVWFLTGAPARYRGGRLGLLVIVAGFGLSLVAALHVPRMPAAIVGAFSPGVSSWAAADGLMAESGQNEIIAAKSLAEDPASFWFAGERLGFRVGDSLRFSLRVIMLTLLFAISVSLSASREALVQLSRLAAVLGTALALFGLAQHFGSHDGLVYWVFPVEGGLGYGPFINRNHYPFFINLAIGLTIGLILKRIDSLGSLWYRMILSDRYLTWLMVALSFMLASLVTCVSRGGLLSFVLAAAIVLGRRFRISTAPRAVFVTALIALPTVCLLVYVGFDLYESRLVMLSRSDNYTTDGRWYLWRSAIESLPQFPWFGSGGQTYQHWDTISMFGDPDWTSERAKSIRADNEILDVANEFGLLGAGCLALIFVSMATVAFRAAGRHPTAAGGAIGVLAVLLHSLVDFGLRVPASGVFATVVAGLICCRLETGDPRDERYWPRRFAFPLAVVIMLVMLLSVSVFRRDALARYRADEAQRRWQIGDPVGSLNLMAGAVAATPEQFDTRLRLVGLAQAALDRTDDAVRRRQFMEIIRYHSAVAMRLCPIAWRPYALMAEFAPASMDQKTRLRWLQYSEKLHPGDSNLAFLTGKFVAENEGVAAAIPHWRQSLTYSTKHLDEIVSAIDRELADDVIIDELMPDDPVVTLAAAKIYHAAMGRESGPELSGNSEVSSNSEASIDPDQASPTESEDEDTPSIGDDSPTPLYQRLAERTLWLTADQARTKRDLSARESQRIRSESSQLLGRTEQAILAMRLAVNAEPMSVAPRLRLATLLFEAGLLDQATSEIRIILQIDAENQQARRLQKSLVEARSR